MPQIDVKVSTQFDGSGFNQTNRALDEIQKKLTKGFRLPDLGKQLMTGLGIGNGIAVATTISNAIVKPFEEAAKFAEQMVASTERSLNALNSMLRARRTDAQELAKLRADDARLAREAAAINTPKRVQIQVPIAGTYGTSSKNVSVLAEQTNEEKVRLSEIGALRQELAKEIFLLEQKVSNESAKRQKENVDASIKANETEIQALKDFEARQTASDAKYKSQLDSNQRNADVIRQAGSEEAALAAEIAKVNALRNVGNGLSDAEADAAIARLNAQHQFSLELARADQAKLDAEAKKLEIAQKISELESDFTRSDADKWNDKQALQAEALKAAQDYLDVMIRIRNLAPDEASRRISDANVYSAGADVVGAGKGNGPNPNSFLDQIAAKMTALRESWGTMAQQVADGITGVIGAAVDGITDGIMSWADRTKTFGQALAGMGQGVLRSMLQTIVQMGAQWLVNSVIIKGGMIAIEAVGDALRAGRVAKENAAEAATLPMKTAGAAASGISSFGVALAFGALAVGLIMALAGGFADGGFTTPGGKHKVAGVVHAGEWVAPQWMVKHPGFGQVIAGLEGARIGAPGFDLGGFTSPASTLTRPAYSAPESSGMQPVVNILMDEQEWARRMQENSSEYFERITVSAMRRGA